MYRSLALYLAAAAWPLSSAVQASRNCRHIHIPVSVSIPRLQIDTTIESNWDAAALTFNFTRRDAGSPVAPLPISGVTSTPVESNFVISANLCGNGKSVLILTHGILESSLYWNPNFVGGESYSLVNAAVAAGYSTLSYDRVGVASSSPANSFTDAQFGVETAILNHLVHYAKTSISASKVALVGHSYGAYVSAATASQIAVDAVVLTGFSGTFQYFAPFVAGSSLRVARLQDPHRWGHLDSGYLTSSDVYAEAYDFFAEPFFDHRVAEWNFEVDNQPFGVGGLPSLLASEIPYGNITAPVLVLQGQYDLPSCGGSCLDLLNNTRELFPSSKVVETVDNLPAGHNMNLHKSAPKAFQMLLAFLGRQGL
ncbi:Alpha/Beta hydrolase protein [Trichoderma austrokoningii]